MAFNYKKHMKKLAESKKNEIAGDERIEKRLEDNRDNHGLEEADGDLTQQKSLAEQHKEDTGDEITEKQMNGKKKSEAQVITEKAMDKATGGINKHRDDSMERTPLMDYAKEYKADDVADTTDDSVMVKGQKPLNQEMKPMEQMETPWPEQVGNVQNSQLLSNYPDRKSFEKSASKMMSDADAMLLHIYTQAAIGNRDLTNKEKSVINDISAIKRQIIADRIKSKADKGK
jgi:hypothetical protein